MGILYYGSRAQAFEVADDELRHFEALVAAKLRRREPFLLCSGGAEAREALWVHEATDLRCAYASTEAVALDRARLEKMMKQSSRASGLTLESMRSSDVAATANATSDA